MKIPQEFEGFGKRDLIRLILSERKEFKGALDKFGEEVNELKRKLLAYENAHTPPSKQKGNQRKYPTREKSNNPVGAPKGHEGTTRPQPQPTRSKRLELKHCPKCNDKLGNPIKIIRKIIEEIPEPLPLEVIEFIIHYYFCPSCDEEVVPTHQSLPSEGRFGPNLQAQVASLRYENRLLPRKIADLLNKQYGLYLTHATVLNILKRVASKLQPNYDEIKEEVRKSKKANADETGKKINRKSFWNWVFVSPLAILFLIRKSRGQDPIKEALGEKYKGLLGCDGWQSYGQIAELIQRCWAHLLREAKWYAQRYGKQAELLYNTLCKMFRRINNITVDTIQGVRTRTYNWCKKEMKAWIRRCKYYRELKKFAKKIENGFEHWFTHILHPEIELTNNVAERALREIVIQEKISKLRTEEGAKVMETIMSVLATWNLRNLNTYSMLRETLRS